MVCVVWCGVVWCGVCVLFMQAVFSGSHAADTENGGAVRMNTRFRPLIKGTCNIP